MKDPLDNGRTQEIPFDAVAEHVKGSQTIAEIVEQILKTNPESERNLGDDLHDLETSFVKAEVKLPEKFQPGMEVEVHGTSHDGKFTVLPPVENASEPVFETTLSPEQIEAARAVVRDRSFSARNPHLGKMVNCAGCGRRHRATDFAIREVWNDDMTERTKVIAFFPKCQQNFTNVKNGFEFFRESEVTDKDGKTETVLVPDLRTAIDPDFKPTIRQVMGSPIKRNFSSPRYNPHPTTSKLQLVERTRKVFKEMGFTITKGEQAKKNMEQARVEASRQLRREASKRIRKIRKQQKASRRINRGV